MNTEEIIEQLQEQIEIVQEVRKFYEEKFGYTILSSVIPEELKERYRDLREKESILQNCILDLKSIDKIHNSAVEALNEEIAEMNKFGFIFSNVFVEEEYGWKSSAGSCGWFNEGEEGWNDSGCSGG